MRRAGRCPAAAPSARSVLRTDLHCRTSQHNKCELRPEANGAVVTALATQEHMQQQAREHVRWRQQEQQRKRGAATSATAVTVQRAAANLPWLPLGPDCDLAPAAKRRCNGGVATGFAGCAFNQMPLPARKLWLDTPVDADYLLGEHASTLRALTARPAVVSLYDPSSCLRGGVCGPPALPVLLRPSALQPSLGAHGADNASGPRLPTELETERTVAGMGGKSGTAAFPHYGMATRSGGSFALSYVGDHSHDEREHEEGALAFIQEPTVKADGDNIDNFLRVDEDSTDDVEDEDGEEEEDII